MKVIECFFFSLIDEKFLWEDEINPRNLNISFRTFYKLCLKKQNIHWNFELKLDSTLYFVEKNCFNEFVNQLWKDFRSKKKIWIGQSKNEVFLFVTPSFILAYFAFNAYNLINKPNIELYFLYTNFNVYFLDLDLPRMFHE